MNKLHLFVFSVLASLVVGSEICHAQASPSAKVAPASALLYKIEGKGLKKPSYLFGTIHLICAKDMFEAATMKTYLDQTGQIMLEMDLDDPAVIKKVGEASVLKDGKTVKEFFKPEEYAKLDAVFKSYLGMSFDALASYKPMISSSTLLMSPKVLGCQPPQMYDNAFAQGAAARKVPVIGLETADEQIAVIDSQPMVEQIKGLNDLANNPQKTVDGFQKLYKLYLTQDSDALYVLAASETKKSGLSLAKFLDNRNINWIPSIEKTIALTPTFIAVGAAHLGGKKGVVSLLRAKGYTLTPIRF